MPRGYWIVGVTVHDEENYPVYLRAAAPAYEKYGARFVVRGGRCQSMEGNTHRRNVVIEFDDYETALACYNSPEYQAARRLRNAYAETDFLIVEGHDVAQGD